MCQKRGKIQSLKTHFQRIDISPVHKVIPVNDVHTSNSVVSFTSKDNKNTCKPCEDINLGDTLNPNVSSP